MTLKLIKVGERSKIHRCCVCGFTAFWGKNWEWYGSYKQLDDGEEVDKICSATCKEAYSKDNFK